MDYKKMAEDLKKPMMIDGGYVADCMRRDAANAIIELLDRLEKAENIASDLCDDFTDFVTGGVHNAAPYCANKRSECVNSHGWCNGDNRVCKGFLPKAAVMEE